MLNSPRQEEEQEIVGRRERRKLETRARLEEAAYTLFHEQGVEETSIEQVCEAADVARRTFYSYYANKRELLAQMGIKRIYARTEPMMSVLLEEFDTTPERVSGMIDYALENFKQFDEVDRQIILLAPSLLTPDNEMHEKIENSALVYFAELIDAGRKIGDVTTTLSTEMIVTVMIGTLNVITTQWATDSNYPVAERLDEARSLFIGLLKS